MMFFNTDAVILRPRSKTNRGGSTTTDRSSFERIPLPGVNIQAGQLTEDNDNTRDTSEGAAVLRTRPGVVVDIKGTDLIEADGVTWEVTGGGSVPHKNPLTGRPHHTTVGLSIWSGSP